MTPNQESGGWNAIGKSEGLLEGSGFVSYGRDTPALETRRAQREIRKHATVRQPLSNKKLDVEKGGPSAYKAIYRQEMEGCPNEDALLLRERSGRSAESGNQPGQSRPAIAQQGASSTCRRPRRTRETLNRQPFEDVPPRGKGYGTRNAAPRVGLRRADVPEHDQHS